MSVLLFTNLKIQLERDIISVSSVIFYSRIVISSVHQNLCWMEDEKHISIKDLRPFI